VREFCQNRDLGTEMAVACPNLPVIRRQSEVMIFQLFKKQGGM
jgi:hypothetical protein